METAEKLFQNVDNLFFKLNRLSDSAEKWFLIFKMNQQYTETFRCEKSVWNMIVSNTREFWDYKLKSEEAQN